MLEERTQSAPRPPGLVTDGDLGDAPSGLTWALLDAARVIVAEVEGRAADAHMTVVQAGLARHLAETMCGIPMTELAARSGMTPPATSQILRRMAGKGLVHRGESPTDSRAVLVRLSETGQREYEAIAARVAAIDRQLGRRVGSRPEVLAQTLARMASAEAR